MDFKVDKDTIISDVLMHDMDTAEYFMQIGMHCIYCPASMGETIEEACMVHGVDPNELIDMLNEHFGAVKPTESVDAAVNEG